MRFSPIVSLASFTLMAVGRAHAEESPRDAPSVQETTDGSAMSAPDAPAASAQLEEPRPNQGHFIALGFHGIGAMAFDESRGTREPTFGQAVSLRVGESLTEWLSLSLAVALGSTYGERRDALSLIRFGITSQWYLTDRWFVQAGFGATNGQGADPEDDDRTRGRYGDFYLAGAGYDLYLSDSTQSGGWVFTPLITADVGPDEKFTTTSLWLGVEVSWWSGLSRDRLALPMGKAYDK